jgi:hypothetical protein
VQTGVDQAAAHPAPALGDAGMYMYIYIYTEREREREMQVYVYICVCVYIYILIARQHIYICEAALRQARGGTCLHTKLN